MYEYNDIYRGLIIAAVIAAWLRLQFAAVNLFFMSVSD